MGVMDEFQWRTRYMVRLIAHGYPQDYAKDHAEAADFDPDSDPEDAADDEVSYEKADS